MKLRAQRWPKGLGRAVHALTAGRAWRVMRPLPYPFQNFFTINSDCDGSVHDLVHAAVLLSSVIRETYGLPICDSYFPKWIYECGLDGEQEPLSQRAVDGRFSRQRFMDRCAEWIRGFHRGWFDTVHGWAYNMSVRVAPDLVIDPSCDRVSTVSFAQPPDWEEAGRPRYLTLKLENGSTFDGMEVRLFARETCLLTLKSSDFAGSIDERTNVCLLSLADIESNGWNDDDLRLEVTLLDKRANSLRMSEIALHTESRADIERQISALASFNIATSNFSTHAGGLIFAIVPGLRQKYPSAAYYSDERASPHYCVDLLRKAGCDFMQTFAHTSSNIAYHIDDLTFTTPLRDGGVANDYFRFLYLHRPNLEGSEPSPFDCDGEPLNPSWADAAGIQIRTSPERFRGKPGFGVVLYTHLNFGSPRHRMVTDGLSEETICDSAVLEQFASLAERYYNLSGTVDDVDRLYIAPTTTLLRMSSTRRKLRRRVTYKRRANLIAIRSCFDLSLARNVPARETKYRDLRGLTFYVKDSHTARLFVDDDEIHGLIRNPADETGRQSITMADLETPIIICGRVPLQHTGIEVASIGDATWTSAASVEDQNAGSGFKLILSGSYGALCLRGGLPDITNCHYLAIEFEKSESTMCFGLSVILHNGRDLAFYEIGVEPAAGGLRIPAWQSTTTRLSVLPLWRLCPFSTNMHGYPVGAIDSVCVTACGRAGDIFHVRRLALLRDDDRPVARDGHVVGGFACLTKFSEIRIILNDRVLKADRSASGFYFCPEKVPMGEVIAIEGTTYQDTVEQPALGRYHEIVTDNCEIDFV